MKKPTIIGACTPEAVVSTDGVLLPPSSSKESIRMRRSPQSAARLAPVLPMRSIEDRITATADRSTGFDYLRLGLAVSILVTHTWATSFGEAHINDRLSPWITVCFMPALVPCFFALSGFLVAGSLERCRTLIAFLGLRALRIFPALAAETLLSAFLIGPLVTTFGPVRYFSDPAFWSYLGNMLGHVQFDLPGVFLTNPTPGIVNRQLWTVPYELYCYLTLSAVALLGRQWIKLNVSVVIAAVIAAYVLGHLSKRDDILQLANFQLVLCFLIGVALFLYRQYVPWSPVIAAIGVGLYLIGTWRQSVWALVGWFGLTYATIYVGLLNPRKVALLAGADYSYGIYLYHYVILQTIVLVLNAPWWLGLILGLPAALAFAATSWRLIESPALQLRSHLFAAEAARLRKPPLQR